MKPQIPWLRVFVEGVVIVGSILLAFGIQAAWDERQEREEEAVMLRALHAEITFNIAGLDTFDSILIGSIEATNTLLQLASPDPQSIEAVRFDSLLTNAVVFRTYHPSTGSIGTVLGRLNLIRSEEVRQEIAGFEERLRDFQENFDWAADEAGVVLTWTRRSRRRWRSYLRIASQGRRTSRRCWPIRSYGMGN